MKKIRSFLKVIFIKKWFILTGLIVIAIGAFFLKGNGNIETIEVKKSDFTREVSVVGTVIPSQETNMAFEMSGRVTAIYKKVGDKVNEGEQILALESGDVRSDLSKARADYDGEVAQLNKLRNNNSTTDLTSIKNEIQNAHTVADDAFTTKTIQLFNNPTYRQPDLKFFVSEYALQKKIEDGRAVVKKTLDNWSVQLKNINSVQNTTDLGLYVTSAKQNLNQTLSYLNDISYALSLSEPNNAVTQTELDKFSSDVSVARTNINKSLSDLNTAFEKVSTNSQDIPYQESRVASALANVQKIEAQLSKNVIRAPFSGVLTKIDTELGEIVGTTNSVISIISDNAFQIETFIPEVNIKDLKISDMAKVKLDAFGKDEVFEAKVINIEPAQTVRDGVSTYKTKFEFNQKDDRIRSGMTANVVITTEKRGDAILISPTVIYKKEGFDYVKVLVGKVSVEKQVTVGNFDSIGNREIISGLSVGEKVLKNPNN
jgi:RND family efflux transporter MFP subunit